jgi:hypothetical protein
MTDLFAGHDDIRDAIAAVRAAFDGALEGDNAFTVGDTELRADQVRGIASMVGGDETWVEREGKRLIRNDTLLGRAFLGYGVGAGRYLSAADFARILDAIVQGDLAMTREPDLAQFVNMVAAEPRHDPRTEPLIWATAAVKLAEGEGEAYFSQEIPGLVTSYDPLHAEIPEGAQLAEGLLPASSHPVEPTLERYEAHLRAELGPDLGDYVGAHLLARLREWAS